VIAYVEHVDRRKRAWLVVALAAFLLSVASKPAAVVFPLTLFAIDWFRRRKFTASVVLEKAPFVAVAIAGGCSRSTPSNPQATSLTSGARGSGCCSPPMAPRCTS
jgi:hypothetical protein